MSATPHTDITPAGPPEAAIREQLDRIVSSDEFKGSNRIKSFLSYLIDKNLSHDIRALTGQVIGVDVFDRPPNFDPQDDSIVRVQARRLRKMLKTYYLTAGRYDPVHIEFPKGGYKSKFTYNGSKVYRASDPSKNQIPVKMPREFRMDIDAEFVAQIISILETEGEMTLATIRADGYPQANVLSYVNDGLRIYFGTADDSEKALNISQNNKVSLSIYRHHHEWTDIEGVSLGGEARKITDSNAYKKIQKQIYEKYPQIATYALSTRKEAAIYEIEPQFITLLDYSRGFGFSKTLRL